MIALRFNLSLFPVQRISPHRISAGPPRCADGDRDVLPPVHLVHGRYALGIGIELVLPDELPVFLVAGAQETIL